MTPQCLHLLTMSPADGPGFQDALNSIAPGDRLLLVQNGVYALLPTHRQYLQSLAGKQIDCFALEEDCLARGIESTSSCAACVSYSGFVELVTMSRKTCTWL